MWASLGSFHAEFDKMRQDQPMAYPTTVRFGITKLDKMQPVMAET